MEKIQLKHSDPSKKTVAMEKQKYDTLRNALFNVMKAGKEMTFAEMVEAVTLNFAKKKIEFKGSIQWHLAWIQMDMVARKELSRNSALSPQTFRLAKVL
jgi:hypothetical protein